MTVEGRHRSMRNILYLACSPRGASAHSGIIAEVLLAALAAHHAGARVVRRDLAATPPGFVDAGFSAAILAPPRKEVPAALVPSEVLIRELEAADALVIATPMHNFTVPAVLKSWIDQVVRIHRTFRSTPAGKIGLLADRPVFVVVASGGWFSGPSPAGTPAQPDFLTPYLRAILGTIGLHDVSFITLEGVTRGPEMAASAYATARDRIGTLVAALDV